jgi:outer membrane protein assembly factor BamB
MKRRTFLAVSAAAPLASAAAVDLAHIPLRKTGKVEVVFNSPGDNPKPNGLQATRDGLWIIDQGTGNRAFLVDYRGKVLRGFETETDRSSGITFDGETLWIGSTYNRQIVRADAHTGKALERHFTPGAGVIYQMVGDPPQRRSPLAKPAAPVPQESRGASKQVGGFDAGRVQGALAPGTGAHGQEWRDGKLWFAVPPGRMVFCVDPKTWVVHRKFPVAGNRPHGIGWEGKYLWVADSNLNAFFKHDPETGEMVEKIQLAESDPLPHGMTIWEGHMWYCDDVGVVCRLRL